MAVVLRGIVWRELLERRPVAAAQRRFLYVAVAIAAHDERIQDESWRLLEPGRKELLLPLGGEAAPPRRSRPA